MNIIIIEDEQRTAKELKKMLEALDNSITVVAILPSVAASVQWFAENAAPDLVFSDIQLGDGLSFEIFKEISVTVPVIFCTAFDQYAIEAFESNSIDYLLKPVEEDMLERSLKKFHNIKNHFSSAGYENSLQNVIRQMDTSYRHSILIHFREQIIPVKVTDILFVHASGGVVQVHLKDAVYSVQYTIDQLEQMLNPQQFFRANRQFIISRPIIKNIQHYLNRRLVVETAMPTPESIIISRLKANEFLRWLEM